MTFKEYQQHDALALAELVRQGAVSSDQLIALAIERIEAVNPRINAISLPLYDLAKSMQKDVSPDAPFAGIPFLIKELGIEVKDTLMRAGSRSCQNYISGYDSTLAQRLRQAGFLFLGKTNVPEFGATPFTESELLGDCRNPWNTDHTPGGSSGGSAAAVAAGIVPLATASDGGGSIRIPASCCGLFGLKPNRGRISLGPYGTEQWSGGTVEGCVSRTVRDSAAYLDATHGQSIGDSHILAAPKRPYLDIIQQSPASLRIAYSTESPIGTPIADDCIAAVKHTVALLKDLGHQVTEVKIPYERNDLMECFFTIVACETSAVIAEIGEKRGKKVKRTEVEANTWAMNLIGQQFSGRDFALQRRHWGEIGRRMGVFHQQYDCLLTSTLAMPPLQIGQNKNTSAENTLVSTMNALNLGIFYKMALKPFVEKAFSFIPYTPFANMTGQPSMSVPLYWNNNNLPIGTMFTGRIGEEDLLLQLAAQLEQAQPWKDKVAII